MEPKTLYSKPLQYEEQRQHLHIRKDGWEPKTLYSKPLQDIMCHPYPTEQHISFHTHQGQEHPGEEEESMDQEIDFIHVQKVKDKYTSLPQLKPKSQRETSEPSKFNHQDNILGWALKSLVHLLEDQQATEILGIKVIYSTC